MRELTGLLSAVQGNASSRGPASPSQPGVGVISPLRFSVSTSTDVSVGVEAGKGQFACGVVVI